MGRVPRWTLAYTPGFQTLFKESAEFPMAYSVLFTCPCSEKSLSVAPFIDQPFLPTVLCHHHYCNFIRAPGGWLWCLLWAKSTLYWSHNLWFPHPLIVTKRNQMPCGRRKHKRERSTNERKNITVCHSSIQSLIFSQVLSWDGKGVGIQWYNW
jgi:hypothetical protein